MMHVGSVFETLWTIICSFSCLHASKKHTLSRMKVRTSSKTIFSARLPNKLKINANREQCDPLVFLQCYFYSGHIHKAHKSTKSRLLVQNAVFQSAGVFSACFIV